MTTSLKDIQSMFQNRLLTGGEEILPHLGGGAFIGVYDHAYRARLVEILAGDFEGVHTLLGDERFDAAMRGYLDEHPSTTRSVRWVGRHLSAWLAATDPWSQYPEVVAMASFEWVLGLAFDAPDASLLEMSEVGAVPPEAWPMLTFSFHPALNTAVLSHDVAPFHQAIKAGRDPEAAPQPFIFPETWAAWREPGSAMVSYRALDRDEAEALAAARDGRTFDDICEIVAASGDPNQAALRAARLLRLWIESGWIIGIDAEGLSW